MFIRPTLALLFGLLAAAARAQETPADFTVAFIGDQGLVENSRAVLKLIKQEGTKLVLHQGDLDYKSDPEAWEKQIDETLGPDLPYLVSVGNHDLKAWDGETGYQSRLAARLKRAGIAWEGDLGVESSVRLHGLHVLLVAPGVRGKTHADFIRKQFAGDPAGWRICSWHKNQKLMQVGGKRDETGWDVYEAAREAGAIIATGHEHSYSRTHLISRFYEPTVADRDDPLRIGPGRTFAFVSGLGGKSIRDEERQGDWWAKVYTSDQKATYGALFGVFHVDGDPRRARFYFKNIRNEIIDRFEVIREPAGATPEPRKLVLVAGKQSHGPGDHEFRAGSLLLKKCLDGFPNLEVTVVPNGWPEDASVFNGAAAVVCYADGGGGHPFVQGDRARFVGELAKKGVGLGFMHYGVEVLKDKGGPEFLDWIGGYYENGFSCNPMWAPEYKAFPDHPVARGVKPFSTEDEWYMSIRFRPEMKGVTPILTAKPSDKVRGGPYVWPAGPYEHIVKASGKDETMMWCVERPDGGRGFGFTGGHRHRNWADDNQRKVVLNALVWLAKLEVPAEGVASAVTAEEMKKNLDPK